MNFKTIKEIYPNRIFRIPDYQRGYAWRSDADKEVVAFWNDLMNLPEGKSHYTGSLILQSITGDVNNILSKDNWLIDNGYTPWFVVDGQQRLTTITIFFQCLYEFLINLPKNSNEFFMGNTVEEYAKKIRELFICVENKQLIQKTYLLGYINNPVSHNYLLRYVFNDNSYVSNEQSYYTLNIKNAKDFFTKNILLHYKNYNNNITVIENLYKKVTQQLKFDLIEVGPNDDFNIFVAFETINNRGKRLSNLEKLKNRLIYLTTLYVAPVTLQLREEINTSWAEIYRQLGRNFKTSSNGKVSILDDDDFLRTHWILYYQYSRKTGNDYVDFLLGRKFTAQNVMNSLVKTDTTQEMINDEEEKDEEKEFDDKQTINNAQESKLTAIEIQDYVLDLRDTAEMWFYTWFPQEAKGKLCDEEIKWMERINRLGIAYFRPLITALFFERLAKKKIDVLKSLEVLKAIERFIFIEFRIQTTRSHYGSSEFNKAARELHKGTKSVDNILDLLNEMISRSYYIDQTTGNRYFKTQNMQVMVDRLFDQKDGERTGYYRWSAIRYFLYEYNAYLENNYHGQSELKWESFKQGEKDKISIEHIFPHVAEGYWKEMFKSIEESKWYIYQGSLGNLLLLSQRINAELQNDDFKIKKEGRQSEDEKKKRAGYCRGSAAEQDICKFDDWTPDSIEQTGMNMLEFMEKRWGLIFKSDEEKKKLLLPGMD